MERAAVVRDTSHGRHRRNDSIPTFHRLGSAMLMEPLLCRRCDFEAHWQLATSKDSNSFLLITEEINTGLGFLPSLTLPLPLWKNLSPGFLKSCYANRRVGLKALRPKPVTPRATAGKPESPPERRSLLRAAVRISHGRGQGFWQRSGPERSGAPCLWKPPGPASATHFLSPPVHSCLALSHLHPSGQSPGA